MDGHDLKAYAEKKQGVPAWALRTLERAGRFHIETIPGKTRKQAGCASMGQPARFYSLYASRPVPPESMFLLRSPCGEAVERKGQDFHLWCPGLREKGAPSAV